MSNDNFKLSVIISLLVVISLSVTYAYTELYARNTDPIGQGGCFEVNYSGQAINNAALQSTVNYLEGASSNIILSRNAGCEIYTEASINIHTDSSVTDAPLENGAMKYMIMQGETEVASGSIAAVTADSENQLLATVPLNETETTYTVYLWIDPTVSKGTYHQKSYSGYLYASSTQSSTVVE